MERLICIIFIIDFLGKFQSQYLLGNNGHHAFGGCLFYLGTFKSSILVPLSERGSIFQKADTFSKANDKSRAPITDPLFGD